MYQAFRAPTRVEAAVARIRSDRRSGASELAMRVIGVFELARPAGGVTRAGYMRSVTKLERQLGHLRPSMAPIANAAAALLGAAVPAMEDCADAESVWAALSHAAVQLRAERARVPRQVSRHLHTGISTIQRPLLISYSSLVTAVLRAWPGRPLDVTVCESRPAFEGRRTAALLKGRAASVTVITEAQAGLALDSCDSVIMGCDTIHSSGSVVNKTGSYLLALAARHAKRPVIVLGDTFKLSAALWHGGESHPRREVWRNPPRGIKVSNVCFETVPAECIDHIVLETGLHRPRAMRRLLARTAGKRRP